MSSSIKSHPSHRSLKPHRHQRRQRDLHRVARQEGKHAVGQAGHQAHPGEYHKPDRAKQVTREHAQQHGGAEPAKRHAPPIQARKSALRNRVRKNRFANASIIEEKSLIRLAR